MFSDPLKTSLLDLASEFDAHGLPVILGGGYGLFLRQSILQRQSGRTVLDKSSWPAPRSTEDLDIFLKMSLVASEKHMEFIAAVLKSLGYIVLENSKFWQFKKEISKTAEVKIDVLSGPIPEEFHSSIHRNLHRLRPKGKSVGLHARIAEEALALEDGFVPIVLDGSLSTGESYSSEVLIPHPFTYILMKLHAFRDRLDDDRKELGQHHALDLFRAVAMMSETELEEASRFASKFSENSSLLSARQIAGEFFSQANSIGTMRIRQHPLSQLSDAHIEKFAAVLSRILNSNC